MYSQDSNGLSYFTGKAGKYIIGGKNYKDEVLVIPDGVISIEMEAFENNENIKKVILSDSVERIDLSAFRNSAVEEIIFGNGLTYIGNYAFFGCKNIKELRFPDSLESIGASSFEDAVNLKHVYFNEGLRSIYQKAFYRCGVEKYSLPESLTGLAAGALYSEKTKVVEFKKNVQKALFSCTANICVYGLSYSQYNQTINAMALDEMYAEIKIEGKSFIIPKIVFGDAAEYISKSRIRLSEDSLIEKMIVEYKKRNMNISPSVFETALFLLKSKGKGKRAIKKNLSLFYLYLYQSGREQEFFEMLGSLKLKIEDLDELCDFLDVFNVSAKAVLLEKVKGIGKKNLRL